MSCMPPDSNGSGASPAEPDQPTQAPPRPATKGSSAVTRPPGLRWYRVVPSGSVTWSTGSRLATTTTGLSAPTCDLRSSSRALRAARTPPTLGDDAGPPPTRERFHVEPEAATGNWLRRGRNGQGTGHADATAPRPDRLRPGPGLHGDERVLRHR